MLESQARPLLSRILVDMAFKKLGTGALEAVMT
jgi:hypothetical protein